MSYCRLRYHKEFSIINLEKTTGKITSGVNFLKFLEYFRKLNSGKENIDLEISFYPIPVSIQILVLFNTVVIHNCVVFTNWIIIIINIVLVAIILLQAFIYYINIFVDFKHDKILKFLEQFDTSKVPIVP